MAEKYIVKNDIKNNAIANIYLFYGSEEYLKRQYRDELIKHLLPDRNEMNFAHFINHTGKAEYTANAINEIAGLSQMPPFISEKRLIICENLGIGTKGNDEFNNIISNLIPTTYIIILEQKITTTTSTFKLINKLGRSEKCEFPDTQTLYTWAGMRIKQSGLSAQPGVIEEFVDSTKISLDNMDRELEKLISYCLKKGYIESSDIDIICIKNIADDAFELTNAIGARDKKRTMAQYSKLYAKSKDPRMILSSLIRTFIRFLNVYQAKEAGKSDEYIMKALGFNKPYAITINYKSARLIGDKNLKRYIRMGLDYQYKLNTGLLDEQTGVEMYILNCLDITSD